MYQLLSGPGIHNNAHPHRRPEKSFMTFIPVFENFLKKCLTNIFTDNKMLLNPMNERSNSGFGHSREPHAVEVRYVPAERMDSRGRTERRRSGGRIGETGLPAVIKGTRMAVRMRGRENVKPGGTAGVYSSCPCIILQRREFFIACLNTEKESSPWKRSPTKSISAKKRPRENG